ncbi:ParB/RepB/Spo0J family partition protein [Photobacterium leiognathi]|uniref:ParB/RepB/Spo0J family partition protein n=1 Tax=Photobacterium leiognathi TaxID=553611 RepID=UPI0029819E7F|nr:ParB/RepB/Spo0J family partition protein [Photobacterium leiognathi]
MAIDRNANFDDLLDDTDVEILESDEKIFEIPKDLIYSTKQVRTEFIQQDIDDLQAGIELVGQISPIKVFRPDRSGKYKIHIGECRWRAICQSETIKTVKAVIIEKADVVSQLSENIHRTQLSPLDVADALFMIKDYLDVNLKQLAKHIGKNETWVSMHFNLNKMPKELKELVAIQGFTDVRILDELRKIASIDPDLSMKLAFQEQLTRDDVINAKKRLTSGDAHPDTPKPERTPKVKCKKTNILVKIAEGTGQLVDSSDDKKDGIVSVFVDDKIVESKVEDILIIGYK